MFEVYEVFLLFVLLCSWDATTFGVHTLRRFVRHHVWQLVSLLCVYHHAQVRN